MIYAVPSRDNQLYKEFRFWRKQEWSPTVSEANESIRRIAEALYPDHPCIIGHMIMMDDLQSEEEQESK